MYLWLVVILFSNIQCNDLGFCVATLFNIFLELFVVNFELCDFIFYIFLLYDFL